MAHGAGVGPLLLHFGEFDGAVEHLQRALVCFRRMMEEPDQLRESLNLVRGLTSWSLMAYMTELPKECCNALASLMVEHDLTWMGADAKVDAIAWPRGLRARGDTSRNVGPIYTAEMLGWMGKIAFILMSARPDVASSEALCSLPSVEEAMDFSMTFDHQSFANNLISYNNFCKIKLLCLCVHHQRLLTTNAHGLHNCCTVVYLACACEKLKAHKQVLTYTAAGLSTDLTKAGTMLPSNRAYLQSLSGRAYAALGRTTEAIVALESAASEANRSGFWLLEAYALRDLQLSVLEPTGHVERSQDNTRRRLGAVLRRLTGRGINAVLNGMDSKELMALPPPDMDAGSTKGAMQCDEV